MTGPKGNSEFCLSQGEHCSLRGNKSHYLLRGQSLSFDDYKKKKEEKRRSKFKKANAHTKRPQASQKSS